MARYASYPPLEGRFTGLLLQKHDISRNCQVGRSGANWRDTGFAPSWEDSYKSWMRRLARVPMQSRRAECAGGLLVMLIAAGASSSSVAQADSAGGALSLKTATPIDHLIVIDHYVA